MSEKVDNLADQVVKVMADRKVKKMNVGCPDDDIAVLLAAAMKKRGFKAEASTGLVGNGDEFKASPIVRVAAKRAKAKLV